MPSAELLLRITRLCKFLLWPKKISIILARASVAVMWTTEFLQFNCGHTGEVFLIAEFADNERLISDQVGRWRLRRRLTIVHFIPFFCGWLFQKDIVIENWEKNIEKIAPQLCGPWKWIHHFNFNSIQFNCRIVRMESNWTGQEMETLGEQPEISFDNLYPVLLQTFVVIVMG